MKKRHLVSSLFPWPTLTACGLPGAYTAQRGARSRPARVAGPQPEVGRTWSLRLVNGYNSEEVARYQEELVEGSSAGLTVKRTDRDQHTPVTERYTPDWKWVSKARPGYDVIEYSPPLIGIPFPLEIGKSWRQHSVSFNPHTKERYPVIVQGRVVGWEKIKTAAGTFDAIRIDRDAYISDSDQWKSQTEFRETDWYVPSLGRIVRSENTSGYYAVAQSGDSGAPWIRGSWNVQELADPVAATKAPGAQN